MKYDRSYSYFIYKPAHPSYATVSIPGSITCSTYCMCICQFSSVQLVSMARWVSAGWCFFSPPATISILPIQSCNSTNTGWCYIGGVVVVARDMGPYPTYLYTVSWCIWLYKPPLLPPYKNQFKLLGLILLLLLLLSLAADACRIREAACQLPGSFNSCAKLPKVLFCQTIPTQKQFAFNSVLEKKNACYIRWVFSWV